MMAGLVFTCSQAIYLHSVTTSPCFIVTGGDLSSEEEWRAKSWWTDQTLEILLPQQNKIPKHCEQNQDLQGTLKKWNCFHKQPLQVSILIYCCWTQVLRTISLKCPNQYYLTNINQSNDNKNGCWFSPIHNELLVLLTPLGHESIFLLLVLQPFRSDTPTVCSLNGRQRWWQRVDRSSS